MRARVIDFRDALYSLYLAGNVKAGIHYSYVAQMYDKKPKKRRKSATT